MSELAQPVTLAAQWMFGVEIEGFPAYVFSGVSELRYSVETGEIAPLTLTRGIPADEVACPIAAWRAEGPRDVVLTRYNRDGNAMLKVALRAAWPIAYDAFPAHDASSDAAVQQQFTVRGERVEHLPL